MSRQQDNRRTAKPFWACKPLLHARNFLLLCLLLLLNPAFAQQTPHSNAPNPLILILCDPLIYDDVSNSQYPYLSRFANRGTVGMMNGAIVGKPNSPAPLLTLAVGQHLAAEPDDALAANDSEHIIEEYGDALTIYQRRTGNLSLKPTEDGIIHLNIASLTRRGVNTQTVGAVLSSAQPPIPTAIYGNIATESTSRTAALFTLDAKGRGTGRFWVYRTLRVDPNIKRDDPLRLAQLVGEHPQGLTILVVNSVSQLDLLLYLLQSNLTRKAQTPQFGSWRRALRPIKIVCFL